MADDRVRAGYDAVAATYAEQFCDELDHKPMERGLLDAFCNMAPDGTIADIGCGPGHITRFLAARRETVVGLDLSTEMIAVARQRNPDLSFAVASMLDLPCHDGTFAGVVAMYSIIHLDAAQRGRAFGEFARILCPDGLLLVSFHVDGPGLAPGDVNHVTTFLGHSVDMDGYFLDPAVVTTELVDNGFRVEARLDREPIAGIEFGSRRCYILARRAVRSSHGPRS
jgi:SAM-dependent methyltransferase